MSTVSLPHTLTAGTPENVNDVQANDEALRDAINGQLDGDNLTTATRQVLGLSDSSTVRRGKCVITSSESRSNAAYGLLSTPDQVANVVVPANGLVVVAYQAVWQESVNGAARAAIFVGANQLKFAGDRTNAAPVVQETSLSAGAGGVDKPLVAYAGGLNGIAGDATVYGGDVTTGQICGASVANAANSGGTNGLGVCRLFVAAGTYTISVQFKASSGSVTARNRTLLVWTEGFG